MPSPRIADLLAGLNPPQRQAVEHRGGPLLVLAGAGSGKTRVITVRIAHLVDAGLAPDRVLALTFTNKAAGEMAERVAELVGPEPASRITVGTFHSLGLRMVEEESKRLGFTRRFTLLDAADQASAVRQCLRALKLDPRRHDPRVFLGAISNARNEGVTPDQLRSRPGSKITANVYQAYLDHLVAYQAFDFDDLILRPIQLLTEHDDLRDKWRRRFKTILVDEYQDTNAAQFRFVSLLAEGHRDLCVVGDDDQSIYGWRGAQVENILGFERHFPDATTIRLEQNYRSTGHILKAANAVIAVNTERKAKELWTSSDDGQPVQVVACKDEAGEARFVAGEVHRRATQEGRPWTDFGVLFRTGAQAQAIADAFRLASIPYKVVGAFDFYQRKEIKDVLSYLRLVVSPNDRASLMRVINFPQRGIGAKSLQSLYVYSDQHKIPVTDALAQAAAISGLTHKARDGMVALHGVLVRARERWKAERDLADLTRFVVSEVGAREAWIRDPTEGPGGHARWKSVERLLEMMQGFQRRSPNVELRDYLRLVTLDRSQGEAEEESNVATLMTLHSAKGLEWPVCFVVGCLEGLIPHQRTLDDARADTSEERRLFYVGITRARRHCFLTYARKRRKFRGSEPGRPSRFLRDIPAAHREDVDRSEGEPELSKDASLARLAALRDRLAGR